MNTTPTAMERLRDLAHQAHVAASLVERPSPAAIIDSDSYSVGAGQVWVAEADDTMILIILALGQDRRTAHVVPATIEPSLETADAWVLPADTTALDVPITAWPDLAALVPVRLLKRPLGLLASDMLALLAQLSDEVPSGVRAGSAAINPFAAAVKARAWMADKLNAWSAMVDELPQLGLSQGGGAHSPSYSFQDLTAIGLPTPEAIAVARGSRGLTATEAAAMAAHLGRPVDMGSDEHGLSDDALVEIEQPRWRWLAEALSVVDSAEARVSLGREAFALAARQKGDDATACRQRLRMLAMAHLPQAHRVDG